MIGYYVAAVEGYDPNDPDTLCEPAWWPEGRYLASDALGAVKAAELAAARAGDEDAREFLAYAGQIGVAMLVSKFASLGLFRSACCVVGFDSGDVTEVYAP